MARYSKICWFKFDGWRILATLYQVTKDITIDSSAPNTNRAPIHNSAPKTDLFLFLETIF